MSGGALASSNLWDQLEPRWVGIVHGQAPNDNIYNPTIGGDPAGGSSRIASNLISDNGNNGPYVVGFVKGRAPGAFKIAFTLGYTWGWSNFCMFDERLLPNPLGSVNWDSGGYNGLSFNNNNSNNQLQISKSDGDDTATLLTDTTGVSHGTIFSLYRDTSNVVKYRYSGASETTVGTWTGTFMFCSMQQSPSQCGLIEAQNIYTANS